MFMALGATFGDENRSNFTAHCRLPTADYFHDHQEIICRKIIRGKCQYGQKNIGLEEKAI
jgi:hypothetical protein